MLVEAGEQESQTHEKQRRCREQREKEKGKRRDLTSREAKTERQQHRSGQTCLKVLQWLEAAAAVALTHSDAVSCNLAGLCLLVLELKPKLVTFKMPLPSVTALRATQDFVLVAINFHRLVRANLFNPRSEDEDVGSKQASAKKA